MAEIVLTLSVLLQVFSSVIFFYIFDLFLLLHVRLMRANK